MSDTAPQSESTVQVTIDGKTIDAAKGELVIDAAERNGVYIPRFCYHNRMNPVGMCRMCLVEIDTGRGPALQPSCMIECTPGMSVETETPMAKKAQEGVLEFLLINHPLDCPVCDKGGECPLQDQTMSYGPGESRLVEEKRHFEKPIPISETVLLDRERCILCDRCTRFAKEVAGDPLIHFQDRGNHTQVNTFPDHPFSSYFSGNTVQICPVGALTAKPYRFKARPWDLEQVESTCTSCSVGCRVVIDSSRDKVLRYNGVDSDPVNWSWLCDKGRFDFEYVNDERRLNQPLVRPAADQPHGSSSWSYALTQVASAIRTAVDQSGPSSVAVIGGARLTNEGAYAWAKLAKGVIGTDNVDAQLGDGLPAEVVLGLPRATIDQVCAPGGTVIVLGPDVKEELPVLFLRLRHAAVNDRVRIIELAPTDTGLTYLAKASLRARPGTSHEVLGALLSGGPTPDGIDAEAFAAAQALLANGVTPTVVWGRQSLAESPDVAVAAAHRILGARPGARFLPALRRGNVFGAIDMGLVPGLLPGRVTLEEGRNWVAQAWGMAANELPATRGLDTRGILEAAAAGKVQTLILLGADPLADFPDRALAERALAGATTVISVDIFVNDSNQLADVILPAAGYAAESGTTTNLEGRVTRVNQKVTPPGSSQSDWMIAAELAYALDDDLGFDSVEQIRAELAAAAPAYAGLTDAVLDDPANVDGIVVPLPAAAPTEDAAAEGDAAEPEAAPADEATTDDGDGSADEAPTLRAPAVPAVVALPPAPAVAVPTVDAYSFRLVVTRKLYDHGTLIGHSPAISVLAEERPLRLNPADLDRLGVADGAQVKVSSSRAGLVLTVQGDPTVPKGVAALVFDQADAVAARLLEPDATVTDLRVETQA